MNAPNAALTLAALAALLTAPAIGAVAAEQSTTTDPGVGVDIPDTFLTQLEEDPSESTDGLIVFESEPTQADLAELRAAGVEPLRVFEAFRTVYAVGPGYALVDVSRMDDVVRVAENKPLDYAMESAALATQARNLWDTKSTSSLGGTAYDGTGVGVAIIDSGFDATHPDLAPAFVHNARFECITPGLISTATSTCFGAFLVGNILSGNPITGCTGQMWIEASNTDVSSGHGTHVAGIVGARGTASDDRIQGAAPGASLYGLGTGHGISVLTSLEAMNWVHCNHDQVSPEIKIVSNSWGAGGSSYDPNDPTNVAVDTLVKDDDLTVVFAVGNSGSGSSNNVNTYARNPTPGVIGVANYDEMDRGSINGDIDSSSSTCLSSSDAHECPDLSAPGTFITSTHAKTTTLYGLVVPSPQGYLPYYSIATGTSMATPHVSGVIAQMLQANPSLLPHEIENITEDTARKFTSGGTTYTISDPSNTDAGKVSTSAGHGLIDAVAALEDSRVTGSTGLGTDLPKMSQSPHVYIGGADLQLASQLQWSVRAGETVDISERLLQSGDPGNFTLDGQTPCQFEIFSANSNTQVALVPCGGSGTLTSDSTGWRMDASYAFPAGSFDVESQIDFGNGFVAFDRFTVDSH